MKKQNPYLYLIIGGPVVVVIASIVTIYIAVTNPVYLVEEKVSTEVSERSDMRARNQ